MKKFDFMNEKFITVSKSRYTKFLSYLKKKYKCYKEESYDCSVCWYYETEEHRSAYVKVRKHLACFDDELKTGLSNIAMMCGNLVPTYKIFALDEYEKFLKNLKKPKKNELTDVEKEEIINEVLKRLEIKTNSVVRKVRLAMIEEIENEIDFVKAE